MAHTHWNPFADYDFSLPDKEPGEKRCEAAEQFLAWGESLCQEVEHKRNIVAVRQAQLLLLHRFFEWQNTLDKQHRNRTGKKRHVCVFEIFEQLYKQLMSLQLRLEPLITMYAQPPPPPVKVVEIDGYVIGERME